MNRQSDIQCKRPGEMTSGELNAIEKLIVSGGEVSRRSIRMGLPTAELIAAMWTGEEPCAVAVIKNPTAIHLQTVSIGSGCELSSHCRELVYITVHPRYRRRGLGELITEALLSEHNSPLFATIRVDNPGIHKILKRNGVVRRGRNWASTGAQQR
jgi:GNAT superfamily N-acetyltransferase